MKRFINTVVGLLIAGVVITGLLIAYREMSRERAREKEREKAVAAPSRVSRSPRGEIIVTLDRETQERIGLTVVSLSTAEHRDVRQGFARVLDATSLRPLLNELALARTNLLASEKELARAKVLAAQTNISEKALVAAENAAGRDRLAAQAAEDKLALAFGRELANRTDLPELSRSLASLEAALIRVDLPLGVALSTSSAKARLFAPTDESEVYEAEFIGPATTIEPEFQGKALLYLVSDARRRLAPGANLTAMLDLPGGASAGVVVPRGALVRSEGRGWAFVHTGDDTFVRREVALTRPTNDGWFVTGGFKPGERVVTTGAQVLLSEMGRSAIRMLE
ncbi:MAG: hypothetical protein HY735_31145 [Verrucomicrobia bacterium]|nr:hypothetical protein [Verrucomicrobiota bacterium]